MPRADVVPVSIVFFLSGAAGLIFEMVWFHLCGLVFGNSLWSTTIVLSSFMAGLALGGALIGWHGRRITAFLLVYAGLEIVVAVSGLVLTYALPELTAIVVRVAQPTVNSLVIVNVIRLTVAFAVLTVPATAMGATLPVLVGALSRHEPRFGTVLGRLYGWNTFGAVVGVVGAELLLVRELGMTGSAWIAAILNVVAAAIAVRMARRGGEHRRPAVAVTTGNVPWITGRTACVLACAFLAGGNLMALEVVWFRFLSMFMINSTLALSLMLAVVLSALALGGLLGSVWLARRSTAWTFAPVVAVAAGCLTAGMYVGFQSVTAGPWTSDPPRILWLATALTFLPALFSGLLFTLTGETLKEEVSTAAPTAGRLVLANTAGAMCGPIVAGFLLLPWIGMERALFAISASYGAVALLATSVTWRASSRSAKLTLSVTAGVAVVVSVGFPFGLMERIYFDRAARLYAVDGAAIVATREGPSETILLMQQSWLGQPVYHRLVTNGFSMTGTHVIGKRYMRSFVYWPMLLSQTEMRRVLVICYGLGVTVEAATTLVSPESIDVVEISRDIIAMSDHVYAPERHPLADPRVRLHVEDGRQFLLAAGERFDLITGEPPPPLTPGAVNLYTREYFQLVYDRLSEGGSATYWVPVARQGEYEVAPIIRAFCEVFENCSLWNGALFDWMLVGSRESRGGPSEATLAGYWQHPVLGRMLREIGFEAPEQIGAAFLGDAPFLNELTAGVRPLTDNYPQRLLPGRSAIAHDPVGVPHAEGVEWFHTVIRADQAQKRFADSRFVQTLWSEPLRRAMLPFFRHQGMINRVMAEGANPLRDINDLHWLLTSSSLRRLPLWMLGTNDVLQRIADSGNDDSGMVEYQIALRALVIRNYIGAASYFAEAERRGFRAPTVRPLRVYALSMANRLGEARVLAAERRPADDTERLFWKWMDATFQVGPTM